MFAKVTLGVYFRSSSKVVTLSWDRVAPVNAWTVIGTRWMVSLRRWAVTTTSPTVAASALAAAPGAGVELVAIASLAGAGAAAAKAAPAAQITLSDTPATSAAFRPVVMKIPHPRN